MASLPAIQLQAERRSIGRGLSDLLEDLRLERKYGKQDWRTSRKDLRRSKARGLYDIQHEEEGGLRSVAYGREDVQREAGRAREDFDTRLSNLITDFQQQGHQQAQAGRAVGLGGGSFRAASASARAAQLARARQPIDVGVARVGEDLTRSLARLGTEESEVRRLAQVGRKRLKQDIRHDYRLGKRDFRRSKKDIGLRRSRGIREARIGRADIARQISAVGKG